MASRRERSAEGSRGSMAGTFAAPWGAVKRARRVDRAASRLLRSMADSGLPGGARAHFWGFAFAPASAPLAPPRPRNRRARIGLGHAVGGSGSGASRASSLRWLLVGPRLCRDQVRGEARWGRARRPD